MLGRIKDRMFGPLYTCSVCGATARGNYRGWTTSHDGKKRVRSCPNCDYHDASDEPATLVGENEEMGVKVYRGFNPPAHWPKDLF